MDIERHDIEILTDEGVMTVSAACLGCFGVHHFLRSGGVKCPEFVITHLPTGHSLINVVGLLETEEEALQVAREVSTLSDWQSSNFEDYSSDLEAKVRAIANALVGSPRRMMSRCGRIPPESAMNEHAARACYED